MEPPLEPPVDRPTKMRWGCVLMVAVMGIMIMSVIVAISNEGPSPSARLTIATLQAGGIHKALLLYAYDHEGRFPEGLTHSNEAFRKLFPDILQEEKPFYVHGSAWHAAAPGKRPDDDIGVSPEYAQALEAGENHWAYVSGLNNTSDPRLPIIADGFVESSPGTYTDDRSKKGGVWKGQRAIVVFVSGAAQARLISKETGFRVLRDDPTTGAPVDIFQFPAPPAGSASPKILNPR